jgi:hypothetical protein
MSTSIKGTTPEISFVSRSTMEKRVRRALAVKGYRLLKSRPGTAAHRDYGHYAIENDLRRVIAVNHDLCLLAHELGVLGTGERLRPKHTGISVGIFVIGKPGTGKTPFDLLAGPFAELADAEDARDLMRGRGDE